MLSFLVLPSLLLFLFVKRSSQKHSAGGNQVTTPRAREINGLRWHTADNGKKFFKFLRAKKIALRNEVFLQGDALERLKRQQSLRTPNDYDQILLWGQSKNTYNPP
jgi:hypothetical protein